MMNCEPVDLSEEMKALSIEAIEAPKPETEGVQRKPEEATREQVKSEPKQMVTPTSLICCILSKLIRPSITAKPTIGIFGINPEVQSLGQGN